MTSPNVSSIPFLPLRNGVLFPGIAITIPVGREQSLALVEAIDVGDTIAVGVQKNRSTTDPGIADLFEMGTYAKVRQKVRMRRRQYQLTLEGVARCHLESIVDDNPFWRAATRDAVEIGEQEHAAGALAESLLDKLQELQPLMSDEVRQSIDGAVTRRNAGRLGDVVTASLGLPTEKEIEVLLSLDIVERLRIVHRLIAEAETYAEVRAKISQEVKGELNKSQREMLLRQQLKAIKKELGEGEDDDKMSALKDKLAHAGLSEEAQEVVDRELGRLEAMPGEQAEGQVIRRYLELIAELPWKARADVADDLNNVGNKLDYDHYGLDEVKKRILEHLAVRKVTSANGGAILCLVGPPGVGKTSLGQSVADATGRPFVRVSLGGARDEADIRGHRRTYIGAQPGRILNALRKVKVKNPILLLDEVDKLGHGWLGSPEAALLEVLDPEQNHTFTDHYLDIAFDLSEVLFICTANTLETVSPPLRDRLEVISLEGYTVDEKQQILRNHLLPKALEDHGLNESAVALDDDAVEAMVQGYTREAGVRQLKRELTKICRTLTLRMARDPEAVEKITRVTADDLNEFLGKPKFFNEVAERTSIPGVATGLAWTPVGGDILFVETSRMPGKGNLEITGKLGDVMKESARAALTYVRSHADELGVDPDFLETQDLHVHVPAGAVPKDGPSAGVTIFTALASLLSGRKTRADTAMTGECTLRGRVLPVGGIKAKVLAAHRAGIKRVILPSKNERDLDEVPEAAKADMSFVFADDMSAVLKAALESTMAPAPEAYGGSLGGDRVSAAH